jgi:GTP cyclohydrolase I
MDDVTLALTGVRALLRLAGEDPDRDGLVDTPRRVVEAFRELTAAPGKPAELLGTVFDADYSVDELIAVGPVPFVSLCEHHLLPFTGHAWIAYLPGERGIVGLSKLPRLLDHYALRPQVQERLTTQVVEAMVEHLEPDAAGCIIHATHTCLSLRGVRKQGAVMVTSAMRGKLRTVPELRAELLALAHR